MSLATAIPFSEHIVFVDESGDHGMAGIEPTYDLLENKFRRSPQGEISGWGLKSFP